MQTQAERENDSASEGLSVVDNSQDSNVRDELEGRANGSVSHNDDLVRTAQATRTAFTVMQVNFIFTSSYAK